MVEWTGSLSDVAEAVVEAGLGVGTLIAAGEDADTTAAGVGLGTVLLPSTESESYVYLRRKTRIDLIHSLFIIKFTAKSDKIYNRGQILYKVILGCAEGKH